MICDLAETYHVLNYKALQPALTATLTSGLKSESRVKMKLSGTKITLTQSLLARIADEEAFQSWAKTKDGQRGRNRPQSILKALTKEEEMVTYIGTDEFKSAWESIINE